MKLATYQELVKSTDMRERTGVANLRIMSSICGMLLAVEELEGMAVDLSIGNPLTEEQVLRMVGDCLWHIATLCIETETQMSSLLYRALPMNNKYESPARIIRDLTMSVEYKHQLWTYMAYLMQCVLPQHANIQDAYTYNIHRLLGDKLGRVE